MNDLLAAANPVPTQRARAMPLDSAFDELHDGVLATVVPAVPGNRRRLMPRLAIAVAVASVAGLVLTSLGGGPGAGRQSGTAWAAEQVRFAEASPLVLLGAEGWRVEYADEESARVGELHFRTPTSHPPQNISAQDTGPIPADTEGAQLNWRPGSLEDWTKDRADGAAVSTTAPALGTTAHVYQYEGGTPGHRDITALFLYDDRVLEFRAGAADVPAFERLLASLRAVDTDTWLSAMPVSAIKVTDHDATVEAMLKGVPVPSGFDPSQVRGGNLVKDRYQLGAAVVGTVACQWFQQWETARASGDATAAREAVSALRTAKDWPVLQEMDKRGDYGPVLLQLVGAMDSPQPGKFSDWRSGLGCNG